MNNIKHQSQWLAVIVATTLLLTGCNQTDNQETKPNKTADAQLAVVKKMQTEQSLTNGKSLQQVLSEQPEVVKARYAARHPLETLSFFDIQAGQTVMEALPGGGWYSKLLLPVLTSKGKLIGSDYAADMYPKFGFFSAEMLEGKKTWVDSWTTEANAWRNDNSAQIEAFQFGSMPDAMSGTADRVLFIRALHNLARFENDGEYLSKALADAFNLLKSGGIVGIVQHKAPEEASDEWASGANGYLKASFIKAKMIAAGFEFVASSEININPKDQPTEKDFVWRLPPTFVNSTDNPELKQQYEAVGESTRMTLKFIKP